MLPAQSLNSAREEFDGSSLEHDDFADDGYAEDDVVSLLEENARLRKLIVNLSEIILRNVSDNPAENRRLPLEDCGLGFSKQSA
jgi:hypothetical protein